MDNATLIIIAGVVALITIVAGVYVVLTSNKGSKVHTRQLDDALSHYDTSQTLIIGRLVRENARERGNALKELNTELTNRNAAERTRLEGHLIPYRINDERRAELRREELEEEKHRTEIAREKVEQRKLLAEYARVTGRCIDR